MPNNSKRFTRRKFLQSTALTAIASASGVIASPSVLRAAGRGGEGRLPATRIGRIGLFRPAGAARRLDCGRGNQRGRRHQGRREDRAGARRCAIDAGWRQCRGREDEFGRRLRHCRRLCQQHLPCDLPDGGALRSALFRRRRRHRRHRHARVEEHVPLRSRIWRDRQDRAGQSRRHQ